MAKRKEKASPAVREKAPKSVIPTVPPVFVAFDEPESSRWMSLLKDLPLYLFPFLLFMVFKAYATGPCSGDENIYFYVGRRIADGLTPYRDVFNAHPPIHLLIAAFFMGTFDFTPYLSKFIPSIAAALALPCMVGFLRAMRVPRGWTLLITLLTMFSYNYITISSHFTGANWSVFLMMAAFWALWYEQRVLTGVLLALAGLISLHLIPAIGAMAIGDFWFRRKLGFVKAARLGFVVAGVTAGIHVIFLIIAGAPYVQQTFGYHMSKTAMGDSEYATISHFLFDEYHLMALAIIGIGALFFSREQRPSSQETPKAERMFALVAFTMVLEFLAIVTAKRVFTYYLAPLVPLGAILSGFAMWWWWVQAKRFYHAWRQNAAVGVAALTVGGLLLAFVMTIVICEVLDTRDAKKDKNYGTASTYTFKPSPYLPDVVNEIVKAAAFNPRKVNGGWAPSYQRYFWHELRTDGPYDIIDLVRTRTDKPGKIFGDASNTGLVALMTNRLVSLEMADTNMQIFKSKTVPIKDLIDRLEAEDPPVFIVSNPRRGIGSNREFNEYLNEKFKLILPDKGKNRLRLYERKDAKMLEEEAVRKAMSQNPSPAEAPAAPAANPAAPAPKAAPGSASKTTPPSAPKPAPADNGIPMRAPAPAPKPAPKGVPAVPLLPTVR